MNEKTIKVGDVVELITDGPRMTVEYVGEGENYGMARCVWFDGDEVKRSTFNIKCLVKE